MSDFAKSVDELRYILNKPFIRRDKENVTSRRVSHMANAGPDQASQTALQRTTPQN